MADDTPRRAAVIEAGGGSIVNTASIVCGTAGDRASKGGVVALTRAAQSNSAATASASNAPCPGAACRCRAS